MSQDWRGRARRSCEDHSGPGPQVETSVFVQMGPEGGGVHPSDRSVGSRQRSGQAEDNVYVAAWTL